MESQHQSGDTGHVAQEPTPPRGSLRGGLSVGGGWDTLVIKTWEAW